MEWQAPGDGGGAKTGHPGRINRHPPKGAQPHGTLESPGEFVKGCCLVVPETLISQSGAEQNSGVLKAPR